MSSEALVEREIKAIPRRRKASPNESSRCSFVRCIMVAIRVIRDITHRYLSVNLGMHFRGFVQHRFGLLTLNQALHMGRRY